MYIVIVGGGSVGYYLARALLGEGHEVLVMDKDPLKCERFKDELGSVCIRGDGCEVTTLAEVGTSRAEVFIATTDQDEDNLVACQVAKHKFEVPRTIARLNNPKNAHIFTKLGVDCTISVIDLILRHIEEEIPAHPLVHLATVEEEKAEIVEVEVGEGTRAAGKKVKDLSIPPDTTLALLIRYGEKPQTLKADTVLQANDRIIAVTSVDSEQALRDEFAGS